MKELKGACIIGQSGGPTSVINASAYGVIDTALKSGVITQVLGAEHGIKGVLSDRLFDMGLEDPEELRLLKYTPSSALGSCRYKIADPEVDDTDYRRILEVFEKHNVRYFFYNGGNDSMDTCNKINQYMQSVGYECRVMGVPKTIDNDLFGTDHCPGYASAAKYIATSLMEVNLDAHVYDTGMIVVMEIMGRHAGWLTAAAALDYAPQALADGLTAAGWSKGEDGLWARGRERLSLTFVVSTDNTFRLTAAEYLAGELTRAGIGVELQKLSWTDYQKALAQGDFDLSLGAVTLSADFDPTPLLSGALNYGKYWNADTNALTDAYRAAAGTARETAAAALWARLAQEAPFAVLCFQNQSVLTQWGMVSGLTPTQQNPFYGFAHWSVGSRG